MENREDHDRMKSGKKRDFSQVQVINRAAKILRTVRDNENINLSELAREVGLARSTVYRIVNTLESEGLLNTANSEGYIQLGLELVSLGAAVKNDLRQILRPYLEGLSIEVDETVDLAVFDTDRLIFLDQVARPRRLRAVSGIGLSFPLHCTANGKAMLAMLPLEDVEYILPEQLQIYTPKTIKTRAQLMQELERVRSEGVGYDCEEHTLGICAVGMVIHGLMDPLVAISIPVPSIRFYGNEEKLVSALTQTCEAISQRIKTIEHSNE